ncbi:unnamed protein product [Ostreobium quekettii]|uniref:Uncharacterized protein n=1 Tax=Ostreobium quekettii TaxID=121088 RepID=A0A8S1J7P4_9CHLO|nr:unnamed protein product [Ostreobium quekettii]
MEERRAGEGRRGGRGSVWWRDGDGRRCHAVRMGCGCATVSVGETARPVGGDAASEVQAAGLALIVASVRQGADELRVCVKARSRPTGEGDVKRRIRGGCA